MKRNAQIIALAAVCASPLSALAQTQATQQNQGLGQPSQIDDVLTFEAGGEFRTHDNVFNLPDGQNPNQATFGDTKRADSAFEGRFGVKFDRDISLQRITLSGEIRPVKYQTYTQFDHLAYTAKANWDWAIGRPWFGTLGARFNQRQSSFADVNQSQENLERVNEFYLTAGMRFTPSWAVIGGVDSKSLDNSSVGKATSDYEFVSTEIGARFAPGTGTELKLVYKQIDGDYSARQTVDSLGAPLPGGISISNNFKEDGLIATLQIKPSNDSTMRGSIGYANRKFDELNTRDYKGPTAGLTLDWRPSGAFFMGVDLTRSIQNDDLLADNFVEVTRLALRPRFNLTGKLSLVGLLSLEQRSFEGEPNANNAQVRSDDINRYGVTLNWAYARNITFSAGFERKERESNIPSVEFVDNILRIGGQLRF